MRRTVSLKPRPNSPSSSRLLAWKLIVMSPAATLSMAVPRLSATTTWSSNRVAACLTVAWLAWALLASASLSPASVARASSRRMA
ncbi:hypothetical protein WR25_12944 [Diploscapter pachys]|uniref:Uncharacterized protein n=1 Tax=Diploscapter pachys TaxID=2018661 RepID=A0A2A2KHW6_9BILA|nr:hypothetical protein WR25_12944 [Diploscapter pachys]